MTSSSSVDRQGVSFSGNELTVERRTLHMPHKILDAGRFPLGVVVVFDYMELPKHKRCENLWALDLNGNRLWVAEAPDSPANSYVNLVSTEPLKAWNFACFVCTLDSVSGRLVEAEFTK